MVPNSIDQLIITTITNKKQSLFLFISLLFLFLLSFNGASIFSVNIPSLGSLHSPEKLSRKSRNLIDLSSSSPLKQNPVSDHTTSPEIKPPTVGFAGDQTNFVSVPFFKHRRQEAVTQNPDLNPNVNINPNRFDIESEMRSEMGSEKVFENSNKKLLKMLAGIRSSRRGDNFPTRVKQFFNKKNETTSLSSACHIRFFMTWISSLNSFNSRAFLSIESIFKTHPNACLLIASNSLDSIKGRKILKPFTDKGFRVTAIAPDFNFLCKKTMAESWFSRLVRGHIRSGIIPLGQNISNLLRLCLLYKYGGVYVDTDVIIMKSFTKLKNTIGAQSVDSYSKKWSRLNNAVMVFDKMHPLVYKFIEEFALTFNGNKWGHNGPYLVSRVVARLQGRPGYNFTVLPPMAFYPMNWDRVRVLFRSGKNETDSRWLMAKYEQIKNQSYALHLWNKQSRGFGIEEGSIVKKILLDHCVFCNISTTDYMLATSVQD